MIDKKALRESVGKLKEKDSSSIIQVVMFRAGILIGAFAYWFRLGFTGDNWGYEGGGQAVILLFVFCPAVGYVMAQLAFAIGLGLMEWKTFNRIWKRLNISVLLISVVPFFLLYYSKKIGLQYEVDDPLFRDKKLSHLYPFLDFLLVFTVIFPVVNVFIPLSKK